MIGSLISHQLMIIGQWKCIDRSLFKAIKVIQDNTSILAYSFNKNNDAIIEAITFITSIIEDCRIDKRKRKSATFQLLEGSKQLHYP